MSGQAARGAPNPHAAAVCSLGHCQVTMSRLFRGRAAWDLCMFAGGPCSRLLPVHFGNEKQRAQQISWTNLEEPTATIAAQQH